MADFYANMAATALKLLTDKGLTLSFDRDGASAYDPVTGATTPTTTTFTGIGAKFNYKKSEIDGTVIKAGDARLILNAMDTPPLIGDKVTISTKQYRLMDVETVSPADTPVIYKAQIRV